MTLLVVFHSLDFTSRSFEVSCANFPGIVSRSLLPILAPMVCSLVELYTSLALFWWQLYLRYMLAAVLSSFHYWKAVALFMEMLL